MIVAMTAEELIVQGLVRDVLIAIDTNILFDLLNATPLLSVLPVDLRKELKITEL